MNGDQRTSAQEVWPTAHRRRTIRFGDGESRAVAMEHWYWTALDEIAGHESMTCDELVREIDRRRGDGALVAALQLFCVSYFQRAVTGRGDVAGALDEATSPGRPSDGAA